jgi:hypothetical protein
MRFNYPAEERRGRERKVEESIWRTAHKKVYE